MSRLRSTLASAPIDKVIGGHVAKAERALRQALDECIRLGKSEDYMPAHVSRVRRDLQAALGATERVRRVMPRYDVSDPDFMPTAPYERPIKPEKAPVTAPVVDAEVEDESDGS